MQTYDPLRCPACGAPLTPPTTMVFACGYCRAELTVAVRAASVAGATVVRLLSAGPNKILAIRGVRTLTGLGLKEAKDLVEGPMPADLRVADPRHLRAGTTDLEAAGARFDVMSR